MAPESILKLLAKHRGQCSTNFATRCGSVCGNAIDRWGTLYAAKNVDRSELNPV